MSKPIFLSAPGIWHLLVYYVQYCSLFLWQRHQREQVTISHHRGTFIKLAVHYRTRVGTTVVYDDYLTKFQSTEAMLQNCSFTKHGLGFTLCLESFLYINQIHLKKKLNKKVNVYKWNHALKIKPFQLVTLRQMVTKIVKIEE